MVVSFAFLLFFFVLVVGGVFFVYNLLRGFSVERTGGGRGRIYKTFLLRVQKIMDTILETEYCTKQSSMKNVLFSEIMHSVANLINI